MPVLAPSAKRENVSVPKLPGLAKVSVSEPDVSVRVRTPPANWVAVMLEREMPVRSMVSAVENFSMVAAKREGESRLSVSAASSP